MAVDDVDWVPSLNMGPEENKPDANSVVKIPHQNNCINPSYLALQFINLII